MGVRRDRRFAGVLLKVPGSMLLGAQRWRQNAIVVLSTGAAAAAATVGVLLVGGGIASMFAVLAAANVEMPVWATRPPRPDRRVEGPRSRWDAVGDRPVRRDRVSADGAEVHRLPALGVLLPRALQHQHADRPLFDRVLSVSRHRRRPDRDREHDRAGSPVRCTEPARRAASAPGMHAACACCCSSRFRPPPPPRPDTTAASTSIAAPARSSGSSSLRCRSSRARLSSGVLVGLARTSSRRRASSRLSTSGSR